VEPGAGEADEGAEGLWGLAVPGGEAAELLQSVETAFDAIAVPVKVVIIAALASAALPCGDDGTGMHARNMIDNGCAVIALIGDDGLRFTVAQQVIASL
jgi:hypothetical protein